MCQTRFLRNHQIARQKWDDFVENSPQSACYAHGWFLDAVMPNWSAILVTEGENWLAVLPIQICEKFGLQYALQPIFSQYLGVLFAPFLSKNERVLSKKRLILEKIIAAIPVEIKLFSYNFSPEFDYFLPFQRNSFEIKPRASLTLSIENSLEKITEKFSSSVLNHLKKAAENGLKCRLGTNIQLLSGRLLASNFIKNRQEQALLNHIYEVAVARKQGFLLEVFGQDGQIQCSGFFLIEKEKAVFLASALDREKRHLGSNSLLILEAIKRCKSLNIKELDFKGSMILGVEQFFFGFNPQPVSYFNISRNRLNFLQKTALFIQRSSRI